jgi:hypothetical protein
MPKVEETMLQEIDKGKEPERDSQALTMLFLFTNAEWFPADGAAM